MKNKNLSLKKKITLSFFAIFLFFFFLEFISRIFIFSTTSNLKAFYYGFNENIKIDINHLIKFRINLIDLRELNLTVSEIKKNLSKSNDKKNIIWAFGGSTTKGNFCGSNASSWPKILSDKNKNIDVVNYGQNGIDSYVSLQILRNGGIKSKNLPQSIIWAHKFNEINVIYQGIKKDPNNLLVNSNKNEKRKLFFEILKIEKTIEKYSLFYKILKNVIITSNRKIVRNFTNKHINPSLTKEDFTFAAKNFEFNTREAIKLSKNLGIKNFYILSLPSLKNFEEKMKDKFFIHYYNSISNLIKKNDNVYFIDLSKKPIFLKEQNTLFCDETHKTLKANILVANFIDSFIQ